MLGLHEDQMIALAIAITGVYNEFFPLYIYMFRMNLVICFNNNRNSSASCQVEFKIQKMTTPSKYQKQAS